MTENYSIQDIIAHTDTLLEMMSAKEDILYGAIDMVSQVRDELMHINSQDSDDEE
jgi:hypothetical protein